jgi:collagen type II alpha
MRMFGGDLSSDEQKQLVRNAYNRLRDTFEGLAKPDGQKNAPAKTCRDLHAAYPDKPSGEVSTLFIIFLSINHELVHSCR